MTSLYTKSVRLPGGVRLLSPLFFVSGFCGLIYESIWSHYLKLFLGHAAYAQSVVLVVFIGGMAIGAWLCGRFAPRIGNPLLAYAAAEFVIGWCAIAFHRVFVGATDWAYATLLPATCSAEGWCVSSWLLAAALILPQSVLLGTTFPLMTSGILRALPQDPGRRVGLLYFLNSFGAVFGVLASAFILIPTVGLPGASMTAGLLNVLLALAVFLIARDPGTPTAAPVANRAADPAAAITPARTRLLLWVALVTGLSSFVYEIAWIRMLSLVLGSSTHAFELMLASFILGLALGGAWIRGRIDALRDPRRFLAAVQILMGLFAIATIALYNASFDAMSWLLATLSRSAGGYVLFNVGGSLICIAVMIAPTFLAGMTLPLITLLLMRSRTGERSIGYVYAWNTLGAIAGVLLAVHVGLPHLGLKLSLAGAALIDVVLGLVLAWPAGAATLRWRAAALASLAAAVAAAWALEIDPMRSASGVFRYGTPVLSAGSKLLFHRDGKTATIDVVHDAGGHLYIQSNGKPDASYQLPGKGEPTSDEYTQVLLAGMALVYRPQAQDVAVIGFGSGLSTAAVLASPEVGHVDTIEIEPAMVEGARHFLPANQAAFSDPRSRIIEDDAKAYFARSGRKYDVILSEPSNPWVSGVSSLFTQEFYARLRHALKPDGVLVQWIQSYQFSDRLLASVLGALRTEFRDFVLYQSGSDLIIVASAGGRLEAPTDRVFRTPGVGALLARYEFRGLEDLELRRVAGRQSLERLLPIAAIPANSDYAPYVDSGAAEARYLNTSVDMVLRVNQYPVPLVELFEQRRERAPRAAPVRGSADAARPARADRSRRADAVHADGLRGNYRMVLEECASPQSTADLWPGIANLAARINLSWPPGEAEAFWLEAARSECLARLPGRYRRLIELYAAVGARDPQRMSRLGIALLEGGELAPAQFEYAVLSALAGSLAGADAASARSIIERWVPQLTPVQRGSPSFVALRALAAR